jgi:O-antigen/teichoic acid export membrane protein
MLSTGVMAVFGFFFWIIDARLYSAEQVGIGTTLISIMILISSFSILGLGNGIIRYLPTSERKNKRKILLSASLLKKALYIIVKN